MNPTRSFSRSEIRGEARGMIALAAPIIIAQISQMGMGFVDTYMVADLGETALAAVSAGNVIYFFFLVFAFGTISAVGPMVSQAFGAGDHEEIERSVAQGIWLATGLSLIGFIVAWNTDAILLLAGQEREVAATAGAYTRGMSWGVIANLWFGVLRGFCDAVNRTRVAMVISTIGFFINALADYTLIYGTLGMPELGAPGAGYSTSVVRWAMLLILAGYVFGAREFRSYDFIGQLRRVRVGMLGKMIRLGLPIGASHAMEHGAFGVTTLMMGHISKTAMAAHQVSIMLAALTFMVPMGLAVAISTRVGQAVGRRRPRAAALSGWVGIGIGTLFMCTTALTFILIPDRLATIFTQKEEIVSYATALLMIVGIFQISDGVQVLAMGALRGLKDTARPMVVNLVAYWFIAIPTGYLLAFEAGMGGPGLLWGLVVGLTVAAVMHTVRFGRLVGRLAV